jgi:hypothetical protein
MTRLVLASVITMPHANDAPRITPAHHSHRGIVTWPMRRAATITTTQTATMATVINRGSCHRAVHRSHSTTVRVPASSYT